jgi:transglutaminase-like putative cysteine protease/Flp pilus assembly protein TadD
MLPRWAPRVLLALFLLSLASVARPIAAQDAPGAPRVATAGASGNPFDAEVRRLQADITRLGRSPRAVLPLLELWRKSDWASPGVTRAAVEALAADRRLSPSLRAYASMFAAVEQVRRGDVGGATARVDAQGFVRAWRVVGPFDNEGKQGLDRDTPVETERNAATDMTARFPGRERDVGWRMAPDVMPLGYVNLDALLRPFENVCALAETYVEVDRARPLTLAVGAGGAVKVYWNGEQVLRDAAYRTADPERALVAVRARAGWNRVLVKSCVSDGTWGFYFRVAELDGSAPRGVRFDATRTDVVAAVPAAGRAPVAPQSALAALEATVAEASPQAGALEDLARFLAWTGADDPAERRAKQLAARGADAAPTLARLRLAASLADERAEVQRFAAKAAELAPDDPASLLLRAEVRSRGPSPEDALALLDRIPAESSAAIDGALLRASLLRGLELTEAALAIVVRTAARLGDAVAGQRALADALAAASRSDRALSVRNRLVTLRYDDAASRRALVSDALQRGDAAEAVRHVEALRAVAPDSARNLYYAAAVYDGLGREDDMLAAYHAALDLAPEDAAAHVAMGRALLRVGQRDAASDALRRAIALRPQDAETRELLENIRPEARQDEAYAAERDELLQRRSEDTRYPVTILQNLTVNTVYENGLGSSFHQIAAQVHDAEGARRWRSYSFQFDPESQRVDVRLARVYRRDGRVLDSTQTFEQPLGEPWYRIYYDTRALVVVFPDLEPGDVVELRYRTDDVSHRNVFADYYGDLHFLQGDAPIKRMEYVLITPASRSFYFNEPRLAGLTHARTTADGRNVDRYVAESLPALESEEGMPGYTEIAPYLHVSTYRSWEDVGRWWWGLVRDQLQADDSLKRTVAELVRGAPDERTKVLRIYDWAVSHTRYVGLEFGIHGYLPYRVPQIVQRGFGDCKDKASLLYVMMREAGIDARIALVRTRRNGDLAELPASLAVFDHAIAYVPGLDLFLDGTAEHSGATELPNMDQGVTVLVVGPNDAQLRRTPVLEAAKNRRERTLEVQLAADGSAVVEGSEEVRGGDASGYRDRYEAAGTRDDRFERQLGNVFPGADLLSQEFSALGDREAPIRFRYRANVPRLAQRDGDELRLEASVVGDLVRSLAATPARRHPLDLGGTSSYLERRVVRLPAGMRVSELPTAGEAVSRFGALRLTIEQSATTVTARTELELTKDRISPNEYAEFRAWVERADALLRQRITLRGGAR